MLDQNITSISDTIWFLLVSITWKWQKVKSYWKKRNKKFCGFFSLWRHPRRCLVLSSPNIYFQKRWFLLANTTWKWQKVKNYWKKTKKKSFGGFFLIWHHPRKGMVQSSPNTYFQKRWFLPANTTWKWQKVKIIEKNEKAISGIFFDMTSSKKGRGSGFPNTYSQQFF